jgi:hypothetical protein
MDTSLWHDLHCDVYLKIYKGRLLPEPIRDPVTRKLLSGPFIVKTDSDPGQLSKEAASLSLQEEMANFGVFILLSLPNGTKCQSELDQMFSKFQPRCKKSAIRVVGMKMKAWLDALKNTQAGVKSEMDSDSDEDSRGRGGSEAEDSDGESGKRADRSICQLKLSNLDLGHIVNGFAGGESNH